MPILGIAEWCLDCRGPQALERARQLGLQALHVDVGQPRSDGSLKELSLQRRYQTAAHTTGVRIAAVVANPINGYGVGDFHSPTYRKCWDVVQASIEAAAELAAPVVAVPSFMRAEIRNERDLERTANLLRNAAEYSQAMGIRIATENSLGVEGHLRLLSSVGDQNVQILIDSQNPVLWGHRVSLLLAALWPHLCGQIHIKDGVEGVMGNARLGAGEAGFYETIQTLHQLGYEGYLILENKYVDDISSGIAQDLVTLRRALGLPWPEDRGDMKP